MNSFFMAIWVMTIWVFLFPLMPVDAVFWVFMKAATLNLLAGLGTA